MATDESTYSTTNVMNKTMKCKMIDVVRVCYESAVSLIVWRGEYNVVARVALITTTIICHTCIQIDENEKQ